MAMVVAALTRPARDRHGNFMRPTLYNIVKK